MKKFIAPQMRVIKYETSNILLDASATVGEEGRNPNAGADPGDDYDYAPGRRIFGE